MKQHYIIPLWTKIEQREFSVKLKRTLKIKAVQKFLRKLSPEPNSTKSTTQGHKGWEQFYQQNKLPQKVQSKFNCLTGKLYYDPQVLGIERGKQLIIFPKPRIHPLFNMKKLTRYRDGKKERLTDRQREREWEPQEK